MRTLGRKSTSALLVAALVSIAAVASAETTEPAFEATAIDTDEITDRIGLVDTSTGIWYLRGLNGAVTSFYYGVPGDYPFVGDWNCDGVDTPGLYRQSDGYVYLRNSNTQGVADIKFFFGIAGDVPLAGDFNGDGCDTVSIYRPSEARIYVINKLGSNDGGLGAAEYSYLFGIFGDKPFVGDFNGNGIDTVGLHRESTGFVYYRDTNTQGVADHQFFFGIPDDRLVSGDWGIVDGVDTPAVFRPSNSTFYFRHTNTQGVADETLSFGLPPWIPIAGRWTPGIRLEGSLPPAEVGLPYSASVTPAGGLAPYTVQKTSGPAWVSVSSAGAVSGTPTAVGTFTVGMSVTDLLGRTAHRSFPLQVNQPNLGIYGALPVGEIGLPYNASVVPAGGVPPYTVQKTSGPAWVSVSGAGVVSGTPTAVGSFVVGMSVTDGLGRVGFTSFPLSINPSNLAVSGTLQNGLLDSPYSASVTAVNGVPPYSFTKVSGPAWVSVAANGFVSGTPNALGISVIGVTVTDFYGRQAFGNIPITIVSGCEGTGTIPLAQCQALVELFKDTNGFGWDDSTAWLAGSPCGWEGVLCNGSQTAVAELELDENNLVGTLPIELVDLTGLISLDLTGNALEGAIPDLPLSLQSLEMPFNEFDSLPSNLGSLTSLTYVDLKSNDLDGVIPAAFGLLTNLTYLDLEHNGFEGTLPDLSTLVNLERLDLGDNGLLGDGQPIPASLTTLTSLSDLELDDNSFAGQIPDTIVNLAATDILLQGNGCLTASDEPGGPITLFLNGKDPNWKDGCP